MSNTKLTPESTLATATLKTKHVAAMFNLKPTHLRRVLRTMPEYADGVFTRYGWNGDKDPMIAKIEQAIKKNAEARAKAKLEAQAKLDKAKAEKAKADAADKVVSQPAPAVKGSTKK